MVRRDVAAAAQVAKLTMDARSEDVRLRAATWRLERRYPEFAPRQLADVAIQGGAEPIKVIVGIDPDAV